MVKVFRFNAQVYDGTLFEEMDGSPRRSWWCEIRYWQDHRMAECVARITEDTALDHLFWAVRALQHWRRYALALSSIEARVLNLELRCLRERPHFDVQARLEWVAACMSAPGERWTVRDVRETLYTATALLGDIERVRVEAIMDWRDLRELRQENRRLRLVERAELPAWRELVREAMTDEYAA